MINKYKASDRGINMRKSKYISSPIVLEVDNHAGIAVQPPHEIKDRVYKRWELRSCPLRACIEYLGEKQEGAGSNFAKRKRYIKHECKCSTNSIKSLFLVFRKINNRFANRYGPYILKYDDETCANILKLICDYIMCNTTEDEKKHLGFSDSSKIYIQMCFQIQLSKLQWLANEFSDPQSQRARILYNNLKKIDKDMGGSND